MKKPVRVEAAGETPNLTGEFLGETSDEERANLSDAQFKTLVIRILTAVVEYGHKIEEKVKAMKSEIKENVQGTNSEGQETRTQPTIWNKSKK